MAIKLPYQQTDSRQLNQFQQALSAALNPITSLPSAQTIFIPNVSLKAGVTNVVPTLINRPLTGWYIIRQRAQASIWDTQDSNTTPSQNLLLHTSADVVVDLGVF